MKRSVYYLIILAASWLMAGCSGQEKEAMTRLALAGNLYEENKWQAARNEIDSIRAQYPAQAKVLRKALELTRLIEIKEAERNIAYCDSLLPVRQAEAKDVAKGFVFEKDSAYEEAGNYLRPQQTVERNVERNYIRCGVNEKGEMYLTSVYFGSRPVNHTGIRVSTKDGLFAQTNPIAYDGGLNYRFEDNGHVSEIVQYKAEKGADAIKFIYANAKERIKVDYTGGERTYTIYMEEADKQSLVLTYNLAVLLADVHRLTNERAKAIKKKTYLEGKLNQ
ncbi:MAG: hypothetical protein LBS05_04280 [Tannerellaceae bacterium]|nr:hypothetical protein [Tannerellaceae bacterium]